VVCWQDVDLMSLVVTHKVKCAQCGGTEFRKETDILDVWFDAGVSHFSVCKDNPNLSYPADMYLEGRDQARGWFQASLLTSMALEERACTRSILTHGYTADETGEKMSKSIGNVVAPIDIINQFGTDVLRLWVASIDYTDDAVVSDVLLRNVQEVYRKVRNTARFLLSNVYDFDIERDARVFEQLLPIDQYALHALYLFSEDVRASYARSDFTAVFHRLTDYCTKELSAEYLDIVKDRLYVEAAAGEKRRSAQTVCWYILDTLTKLIAPILSFTAEHISDYYQRDKQSSIHLQTFAEVCDIWRVLFERTHHEKLFIDSSGLPLQGKQALAFEHVQRQWHVQWTELFFVRDAVLKAIELQREKGVVKHSLESCVRIFFDKKMSALLRPLFERIALSGQPVEDFLRELCIVSQVIICDTSEGVSPTSMTDLFVSVDRAQGDKCPRCWQYDTVNHPHNLCGRCVRVIEGK
jgi:isoleucyl-tRNA synthetase